MIESGGRFFRFALSPFFGTTDAWIETEDACKGQA